MVSFITNFIRSEPFKVRYIARILPVDRVIDTKLDEVVKAARDLSSRIGQSESFRITIEARDSPYSVKQLIDAIADVVNRKVSLDSPDKIVFVQVFGEYTCISVVAPQEILSVTRLKRAV